MINSVSSIELPSSPYFQGEKLFYNDWKSSQSPSTININIIDHISGTIDRCINITSLSSQAEQDANAQQPSHTSDSSTSSIIIVHNQSVIFCDCELGLFISYDLLSYTNISYLTVKVKKGNCINNVECSRQNNILFYTITGDSLIHAIAIQDGRLNLLEDLKLSIPNNEVSDRKPNFILDPNRSHLLILSESGYIQVYDYSVWAKLMKKKFFDVVMDSNSEEHSESMDNRSASNQSITLIGAFDFPQLESNVPCKCTHWAVNHDFTILHAVYNRDVMCTYSLGPISIASNSVSSKTKIRPTSVYQNMSKSSLILSAALSPRGDYCYQLMQTDKIASSGSRPSSLSISARSLSDYTLPPLHCEDLVIDSSFPIVSHFCLCPISDRFILLTKSVDQKGRFMDATKVLFVAFSQWWRLKVCPTFVIAPLTLPLHNFKRESINNIGDKNSIDHSVLALVPSVDILDSSNLGKTVLLFCLFFSVIIIIDVDLIQVLFELLTKCIVSR